MNVKIVDKISTLKTSELTKELLQLKALLANAGVKKRYYTCHYMLAFQHHVDDLEGWLIKMKDCGYNLLWAHSDGYIMYDGDKEIPSYYIENLRVLLELCYKVGLEVVPGVNGTPEDVIRMMKDSWEATALMRINGKRVFSGYNYQSWQKNTIAKKVKKEDYHFIPFSYLPFSYDGGRTFIGERTVDGRKEWAISNAMNQDSGGQKQIEHYYKERTEVDGYMSFSVDNWGTLSNTLSTNRLGLKESNKQNKFFFSGINTLYASASYTDYGFKGLYKILREIIDLPLSERPIGLVDITANDYAEFSYMAPAMNEPVDGIFYIPNNRGYTLGPNIRNPLTDHSGLQAFIQPFTKAFLNNHLKEVIEEERMFCWYYLHPKDTNDKLPEEIEKSAFNIKNNFNINSIRIAAHLTRRSKLAINDVQSEVFDEGMAWFEIPLGDFRGKPKFEIIPEWEDQYKFKTTKYGPQPITDDASIGQYNPLIIEL